MIWYCFITLCAPLVYEGSFRFLSGIIGPRVHITVINPENMEEISLGNPLYIFHNLSLDTNQGIILQGGGSTGNIQLEFRCHEG